MLKPQQTGLLLATASSPLRASMGPEQAQGTGCHPELLPGRLRPQKWVHRSHVHCASQTGEDRTMGGWSCG